MPPELELDNHQASGHQIVFYLFLFLVLSITINITLKRRNTRSDREFAIIKNILPNAWYTICALTVNRESLFLHVIWDLGFCYYTYHASGTAVACNYNTVICWGHYNQRKHFKAAVCKRTVLKYISRGACGQSWLQLSVFIWQKHGLYLSTNYVCVYIVICQVAEQ